MSTAAIPNRPVFRSQEVCEIAQVPPYVLKSWEAEFPDLGTAKTPNGQRVYRRADVERVLRLKHLIIAEGLTLSGARKRLTEEGAIAPPEPVSDHDVAAMLDHEMRESLRDIRRGLSWVLGVLSGDGLTPQDRVLAAAPSPAARAAKPAPKKPAAKAAARKPARRR